MYEHYRRVYRADVEPSQMSFAELDPTPSQMFSEVELQRMFFETLLTIPAEMRVLL
jgi:hypothetical protein